MRPHLLERVDGRDDDSLESLLVLRSEGRRGQGSAIERATFERSKPKRTTGMTTVM